MELYYYQDNGINQASAGFRQYLRQLLVMPTGSGKTVVFAEIIKRAILKNKTVLVLTDRKELHKQSIKAVNKHSIPVCEITEKTKSIYLEAKLFIGMVETVSIRIEQLKSVKFDLIIIDEAHKENFYKILDILNDVPTLGCTATPINKKLHLYYQNLICPIDVPELIEKGYLAKCISYEMTDDFSDLKIQKSGDDYTEKSLFNHFNQVHIYGGLVDEYRNRINGQKTIIFCVNVRHVMETYNTFLKEGFPVYYVHSKMKDHERDFMIKSFEEDANGIIINCGILCTGYDHPPITGVMIAKKTLSLALWLQMNGRGGRTYDFKSHFTVLDFGGNLASHGAWNEPRAWSLALPKKNKRKSILNISRTKRCEKCQSSCSVSATKCSTCNEPFLEKTVVYKVGTMKEFKPETPTELKGKRILDLDLYELMELQRSKKFHASFIWRVIRSKGEYAIENYALSMEYKKGWVQRQFEQLKMENKMNTKTPIKNYLLK